MVDFAELVELRTLMDEGRVQEVLEHQGGQSWEALQRVLEEREQFWDKPWVKEGEQALALDEERRDETREELYQLAEEICEEVERRLHLEVTQSNVLDALDDEFVGHEVQAEELERILDSEDLTPSQEQTVRFFAWLQQDLD